MTQSIKVVLANTLVYYQDTVGYVQGMNYMVLYFLELWKDEFLAFKAMLLVLDEFYMVG